MHSADQIILRHERSAPREFQNVIREDRYALRIALCQGEALLHSDGKRLHDGLVMPGMMRLMSPGEEVRGVVYSAAEAAVFDLPGPLLRARLDAVRPRHRRGEVCFVDAMLRGQPQAERLGRLALRTGRMDPVHAQLFVNGVADSLLALLLFHHGVAPKQATKAFTPAESRLVADFAEAHLDKTLNLDTWAAVLGMRAPEFTRRFRATMGYAPYAWFMQRRIERAKELLRSRRITIAEVSSRVGFCSQSHFTEAFRRLVNTSPGCWQREQAR